MLCPVEMIVKEPPVNVLQDVDAGNTAISPVSTKLPVTSLMMLLVNLPAKLPSTLPERAKRGQENTTVQVRIFFHVSSRNRPESPVNVVATVHEVTFVEPEKCSGRALMRTRSASAH